MKKTIPFTYNRLVQVFLSGAAASVLVLASYAYVVDGQIPDTKVPSSYKAFLLQEVSKPKLIIDSGSNSHHGIDAGMISEALKINAINIADNAGYDIESKVTRIKAHAKKGDIVLLPLEWSYYTRDRLTDDFVDTLFGPSRDYYTHRRTFWNASMKRQRMWNIA